MGGQYYSLGIGLLILEFHWLILLSIDSSAAFACFDHFLGGVSSVVHPTDFGQIVQNKGGEIDSHSPFRSGVVPWEGVMEVVVSFT